MSDLASLPASLATIATTGAGARRVLDGFGLDYCCHGGQTLAAACASAGLDAQEVDDQLRAAMSASPADEIEHAWTTLDAPALADHIIATHHAYLHEELPALDALARKVLAVHGTGHPELHAVHRLVTGLRADMEPHLAKEESILFPAIRAMASTSGPAATASLALPIQAMTEDHDRVGDLLRELSAITAGYAVPDDACASYQALYERLEHLEADTHEHILKEHSALFPAALLLAAR